MFNAKRPHLHHMEFAPFVSKNSFFSLLWAALLLVFCGCGASEDPAAGERLKAGGAIVQKYNDQIVGLNTTRQPITAETAADIAALGNLKNIDFTASELDDDILAAAVGGLNPVSLVLNETAVTDRGIAATSGFSRVEALFLRDTAVGDEAMKTIGKLSTLTELDLTGTKITNDGLAHLAGLNNLKRLIAGSTAIDDAGMENLKSLTALSKLEVPETGVTPAGVKSLGSAIPGIVIQQ